MSRDPEQSVVYRSEVCILEKAGALGNGEENVEVGCRVNHGICVFARFAKPTTVVGNCFTEIYF